MFERFTADARAVVIHAQQHARRLRHRYIGCEHLLLALTATDTPSTACRDRRPLPIGRLTSSDRFSPRQLYLSY